MLGTRDEQVLIVGIEAASAGSPLFQRLIVTAEVDDVGTAIDVRLFEVFVAFEDDRSVVVSVDPT